jgi:hypothetical protein
MVAEDALFKVYNVLLEDRESARLVVEALTTLDRALEPAGSLLGEASGLSLASLSLSLVMPMCFGLNILILEPFFCSFSGPSDDIKLLGKAAFAAVAAAVFPIRPFLYCCSTNGACVDAASDPAFNGGGELLLPFRPSC